ncbi:MAG: hypothetical protein KBH07_10430 [Flavobacteriales bacterium]|nr:hypothetical protein [Flavobacteriales bacterium]MBP9080808.1 hypothetical protein [Flavobacteriales bacterium]
MKSRLVRSFLYYLFSGLGISALALVNHYPLVYADSGTYIANMFSLVQNDDRPIGYALIMRAVTWQGTLWTMVVFQGMLASWLLMLLCRVVITEAGRWVRVHLVLLTVLVLCSSLPWYSAQIMADHFTPLVLIIVFLLFHARSLGPWREGALWAILYFALATHNAHYPMAAALSAILLFGGWLRKVPAPRVFWWRWAGLNVVIGSSALMIMLFNLVDHGHLRLSNAGNVFLAGRLCEGNIMADYLAEVCPAPNNPLCDCQDDLPGDAGHMLWSANGLPSKLGITIGEADSLLAPVVSDVLARREYVLRYFRSAAVSTLVQLFQWDVGAGLDPYMEGSTPYYNVEKRLPAETYSYRNARQTWGFWNDLDATNRRVAITLVLSILILAFNQLNRGEGTHSLMGPLIAWVLVWLVLNAAITSSLSVVDPRLQSRVLWLLTMAASLVLAGQPSFRGFFRLGMGRTPE